MLLEFRYVHFYSHTILQAGQLQLRERNSIVFLRGDVDRLQMIEAQVAWVQHLSLTMRGHVRLEVRRTNCRHDRMFVVPDTFSEHLLKPVGTRRSNDRLMPFVVCRSEDHAVLFQDRWAECQ